MSPYERQRHQLNPHKDSRAPYQSEQIQWNDGYDKGYAQAKKEADSDIAKLKKFLENDAKLIDQLQETIARLGSAPNN